jgi:hypothetical protein
MTMPGEPRDGRPGQWHDSAHRGSCERLPALAERQIRMLPVGLINRP